MSKDAYIYTMGKKETLGGPMGLGEGNRKRWSPYSSCFSMSRSFRVISNGFSGGA